jgi:hypothetical protein
LTLVESITPKAMVRSNVYSVNAIRLWVASVLLRSSFSSCSLLTDVGDQLVGCPIECASFLIDVLRYCMRRFAPSAIEQRVRCAHTCSGWRLSVVAYRD